MPRSDRPHRVLLGAVSVTVGAPPRQHPQDVECALLMGVLEPDPPVTDAESPLRWHDAVQAGDIALLGRREALHRANRPLGHGLVQTLQVSARAVGPVDRPYHGKPNSRRISS